MHVPVGRPGTDGAPLVITRVVLRALARAPPRHGHTPCRLPRRRASPAPASSRTGLLRRPPQPSRASAAPSTTGPAFRHPPQPGLGVSGSSRRPGPPGAVAAPTGPPPRPHPPQAPSRRPRPLISAPTHPRGPVTSALPRPPTATRPPSAPRPRAPVFDSGPGLRLPSTDSVTFSRPHAGDREVVPILSTAHPGERPSDQLNRLWIGGQTISTDCGQSGDPQAVHRVVHGLPTGRGRLSPVITSFSTWLSTVRQRDALPHRAE
ncbi:hypothetical protein BJ962_003824 [Streptomyces aureorectus]|nr:hypothetical protein [Streptomyces calvus]